MAATIKALRTHSAMDHAKTILRNYADQARGEIADLPAGPAKDALLNLCDAIITRSA